jgi:hypothetical protein
MMNVASALHASADQAGEIDAEVESLSTGLRSAQLVASSEFQLAEPSRQDSSGEGAQHGSTGQLMTYNGAETTASTMQPINIVGGMSSNNSCVHFLFVYPYISRHKS